MGVVMLAYQPAVLHALTRPLAAIGRTALTNYLLRTILYTTLLDVGWFGSAYLAVQVGLVAAVWTVQLFASPLWLPLRSAGVTPMELGCVSCWEAQHGRRIGVAGLGLTMPGARHPPAFPPRCRSRHPEGGGPPVHGRVPQSGSGAPVAVVQPQGSQRHTEALAPAHGKAPCVCMHPNCLMCTRGSASTRPDPPHYPSPEGVAAGSARVPSGLRRSAKLAKT